MGAVEGVMGGQANERALELADVGGDLLRDKIDDVGWQGETHGQSLLSKDGDASFEIGRLEFGDKAGFEAGDEPLLQVGDFGGGAVTGEDDLLVRVEERVESMEELLLQALFAGEEVDVVDEQEIYMAIAPAEIGRGAVLDGVDELIGKLLGGDVDHLAAVVHMTDVMANSLHEMGLAEPDTTVDEERIVRASERLRNGKARGLTEMVAIADDKGVEGVVGVQGGRGRGKAP